MEPVLDHPILISFVNIKENVKFPVFLHCWCFRNNDTFLFKVDIFKSGLTHLPWKEQPGSTEMLLISPRPKQHGPVSWCRSIKQVCKLILSQFILGFRGWLLFFFFIIFYHTLWTGLYLLSLGRSCPCQIWFSFSQRCFFKSRDFVCGMVASWKIIRLPFPPFCA